MMDTYAIRIKELGADAWTNIEYAVLDSLSVRDGFASLGSLADVGKLKVSFRASSLNAATQFGATVHQVQVLKNGVVVFEGVNDGASDVVLINSTDYVFVEMSAYSYTKKFELATVPSDTIYEDIKICDPSDQANSLVHKLYAMLVANLPTPYSTIVSTNFSLSTTVSITDTLELVILEEGESVLDYLMEVLYQNGCTLYQNLYSLIILRPFDAGRTATEYLPITSVQASPSISQKPWVVGEKVSVRFPKVLEYDNEIVYQEQGEEQESGAIGELVSIAVGDTYPEDDTVLEASYGTERETDDIELVHAVSPSFAYVAKKLDSTGEATVDATLSIDTQSLGSTSAKLLLNNSIETQTVSLRSITITASKAYYRDWSKTLTDERAVSATADEDEVDGLYMASEDSAKDYIRVRRAQTLAEQGSFTFKSNVSIQPNTLLEVEEMAQTWLVRYRTWTAKTSTYEYECVAFDLLNADDISVFEYRKPVYRPKDGQDGAAGASPVPVVLQALGDADGPYNSGLLLGDDGDFVLGDDDGIVGIETGWVQGTVTPGDGEYVYEAIGFYTPPDTWPQQWTISRKTGDTGSDGIGVSSITPYYAVSTNGTTAPSSGWSTSVPSKAGNQYMWQYEVITYTDSSTSQTAKRVVSGINGADGANGTDGVDGADGIGVTGIVAQFAVNSSNTSAPTSGWSTTVPTRSSGQYLWQREKISYTSGSDAYTTARVVTGDKGDAGQDARTFVLEPDQSQIRTSARGTLIDRTIVVNLETLMDVEQVITPCPGVEGVYAADETKTETIAGQNAVKKFYLTIHGTNLILDQFEIRLDGELVGIGDPSEDDTELGGFIEFDNATAPTSLSVKALSAATITDLYIISSLVDWEITDGQLIPIEYEEGVFYDKKRLLLCDTVSEDTIITATYQEYTSSTTIVQTTVGTASPQYLGASNSVPQSYNGEGLILGDFFLYTGETDGTFTFGRIYEYNGASWNISENGDHLAMVAVDALNLAKATGDTVWAANAYIDTLTTARLIVHKYIRSTNWDTDDDDVPISGFYLDGIRGVLRAYGLEAYGSTIYGWLESDGFKTLVGSEGLTIPAQNLEKTLYRFDDFAALIPNSDGVLGDPLTGSYMGIPFTRATRRNDQRIKLAEKGSESEGISAGESHDFTKVRPTMLGSPNRTLENALYIEWHVHYSGQFSARKLVIKASNGGAITFSRNSGSYADSVSVSYPSVGAWGSNGIYVNCASSAWWGYQTATNDYIRVWSQNTYTGICLYDVGEITTTNDTEHLIDGLNKRQFIEKEYEYQPLDIVFNVAGTTQDDLTHYVSPETIRDAFSSVAIGLDSYCTGSIKIQNADDLTPTTYVITRISRPSRNQLVFHHAGGSLPVEMSTIRDFAFKHFEIVTPIVINDASDGIEVKHVLPWEQETGNLQYAIGSDGKRFAEGWFGSLDVMYNVSVGGGITAGDGCIEISAPTPYIDFHFNRSASDYTSRIIESASGLLTIPASLSVGNALYYKPTTQFESDTSSDDPISKTISAMAIGEHKLFKWKHYNTDDYNSKTITIVCPSGGTYLVTLTYRVSTIDIEPSLLPATSSTYYGPYEWVIAGGTSITFYLTEKYRAFINMTLWRLS